LGGCLLLLGCGVIFDGRSYSLELVDLLHSGGSVQLILPNREVSNISASLKVNDTSIESGEFIFLLVLIRVSEVRIGVQILIMVIVSVSNLKDLLDVKSSLGLTETLSNFRAVLGNLFLGQVLLVLDEDFFLVGGRRLSFCIEHTVLEQSNRSLKKSRLKLRIKFSSYTITKQS
jgi:hypothetical protein